MQRVSYQPALSLCATAHPSLSPSHPPSPYRLRALLQPLVQDAQCTADVARLRLQRRPGVVKVRVGLAQQLVLQRLEGVASVVLTVTPGRRVCVGGRVEGTSIVHIS